MKCTQNVALARVCSQNANIPRLRQLGPPLPLWPRQLEARQQDIRGEQFQVPNLLDPVQLSARRLRVSKLHLLHHQQPWTWS